MRIEQLVDEQTKRKLNYTKQSNGKNVKRRKQKHRKKEKLSERDLKELMGQYQPTYKRKNGAYRQR